jgi:hypothetical protein
MQYFLIFTFDFFFFKLWCNTVETLLNENYNLAKNVLYEELRESLKKDFLTGSVDPDKKACHIKYTERTKHLKRRFKLFQVIYFFNKKIIAINFI